MLAKELENERSKLFFNTSLSCVSSRDSFSCSSGSHTLCVSTRISGMNRQNRRSKINLSLEASLGPSVSGPGSQKLGQNSNSHCECAGKERMLPGFSAFLSSAFPPGNNNLGQCWI